MKRLALALAIAALAAPALAGQAVTLKPDTTDADGVVTLGDLFEGAGAAARTPVAARATATLSLDAFAVQAAARRAGLDWANAEGVRRIVVRGAVATAAGAVAPRAQVEALTYARSLAAGEIVQPQDVVWGKLAAAPADAPTDAEQVIGLAAKRPLRAGAAVAAHDVSAPQVVKIGETVTVTYDFDGVTLAMQGKALSAGSLGETVNVQNLASKKTVQAVVSGPGQALVGPAADSLKSTRYALR